jgi:hypothetical protein
MRTRSPADEPCIFTPGGQVHETCELGHPCTVADGPVHVDGFEKSSSWNNNKASLTPESTGRPIEYSMFASVRPETKSWVVPAESALKTM